MPVVTVVTPTFNAAHFIERAIASVLSQDIADIEHIIVDGGSTDGTVEILQQHPGVRWISEPDSGQSNALNKGFRMAMGDVVGWLNVDDLYPPGSIRAALDYLDHHPECDIVYGDCLVTLPDGEVVTTWRSRPPRDDDDLINGLAHTPAVFFRRRVFERVGYLDESLHYVMDNEFLARAASLVTRHYLPVTLGSFTLEQGSKSMTGIAPFALEMTRVCRDLSGREPYRSRVSAAAWQRAFARFGWMAAVALTEAGEVGAAAESARSAIDEHELLVAYADIVAEALVVRYIERETRDRSTVGELIERLPISETERRQVAATTAAQYEQLFFTWAHRRRDWPAVYASGRRAIASRDRLLRWRGFWPIWARSLIRR